jgi:hypothetical protein
MKLAAHMKLKSNFTDFVKNGSYEEKLGTQIKQNSGLMRTYEFLFDFSFSRQ